VVVVVVVVVVVEAVVKREGCWGVTVREQPCFCVGITRALRVYTLDWSHPLDL
jgi:hypothetical protein